MLCWAVRQFIRIKSQRHILFNNILIDPFLSLNANLIFDAICSSPHITVFSRDTGTRRDIFEHLQLSTISRDRLIHLFIWRTMQFRNIQRTTENTRTEIRCLFSNFKNIWKHSTLILLGMVKSHRSIFLGPPASITKGLNFFQDTLPKMK